MSKKLRSVIHQAIGAFILIGGYIALALIGELICKLLGVAA